MTQDKNARLMRAALQAAIDKAGGYMPLAAQLGISYQAVQDWTERGRAPAERVLQLERVTGVSRHRLRPDVFGPSPKKSVPTT